MRFAYLDEAGTSRNEPHALVGGVLINADDKLIQIEQYIQHLIEKHIPEADQEGFVLHTTEIWSGTKYFENRDIWPLERRTAILADLVKIPEKFEIPLVFGYVDKSNFVTKFPQLKSEPRKLELYSHATAFVICTAVIERTMRTCWPNEVAQLVAEDHPDARATIREGHSFLQNPEAIREAGLEQGEFPLERIRGGILFSAKTECPPLQIADMCAFFIRGHLRGIQHAEPYYEMLKKWLSVLPIGEASPWDTE